MNRMPLSLFPTRELSGRLGGRAGLAIRSLGFLFLLLFGGCSSINSLASNSGPGTDKQAEEAYAEAVKDFNKGRYEDAIRGFRMVGKRPFNRVTTASLYLSGLSYYHLGDYGSATSKLQYLVRSYPSSIYAVDATYHKGLIMLKTPDREDGGLFVLLNLVEQAKDPELRQLAEDAALNFLYHDATLEFLKNYKDVVRKRYRDHVYEALAYRYDSMKLLTERDRLLKRYREEIGELTPRLRSFVPLVEGTPRPEVLRIALLLPLKEGQTSHPSQSREAITFYAGVQLALANRAYPGFDSVTVKVFDTQDNAAYTAEHVLPEVATFAPEVLIGDLFNLTTPTIAKFAADNHHTHIVPISPLGQLVEPYANSYLFSPSLKTQAVAMARYAEEQLQLRRIHVVEDGLPNSILMAKTFAEALEGGFVEVTVHHCGNMWGVEKLHKVFQESSADGVFLPLFKPDVVNFFLTKQFADSLPMVMMGIEKWEDMSAVETEKLHHFGTLFPAGPRVPHDAEADAAFVEAYLNRYASRPNREARVGFDLMQYLLETYGRQADPVPLPETLQEAEVWEGLQQDVYFARTRENQAVQIYTFHPSREVRPVATPLR